MILESNPWTPFTLGVNRDSGLNRAIDRLLTEAEKRHFLFHLHWGL